MHSYNNIPQGTCKYLNFCDFSSNFDIYKNYKTTFDRWAVSKTTTLQLVIE